MLDKKRDFSKVLCKYINMCMIIRLTTYICAMYVHINLKYLVYYSKMIH